MPLNALLVKPQLLVSVRAAGECLAALAGGCDIIDVKEPAAGPLGMADVETIAEIIAVNATAAAPRPVSVALGEAGETPSGDRRPLPAGIAYAKLGLSRLADRADWRTVWRDTRRRFEDRAAAPLTWIAVHYADAPRAFGPPLEALIDAAAQAGCAGLLVDTFDKSSGTLLDGMSLDELSRLAGDVRRRGLFLALAGRLSAELLPGVAACGAEVIGVRSAACRRGLRDNAIDETRVRELQRLLASSRRREAV